MTWWMEAPENKLTNFCFFLSLITSFSTSCVTFLSAVDLLLVQPQSLLSSLNRAFSLALDLLTTLVSERFLLISCLSFLSRPLGGKHLTEATGLEVGLLEGRLEETLTIHALISVFMQPGWYPLGYENASSSFIFWINEFKKRLPQTLVTYFCMDHDVTKIQKPHKVCKLSGPSAAVADMTDLFICSSCRVSLVMFSAGKQIWLTTPQFLDRD